MMSKSFLTTLLLLLPPFRESSWACSVDMDSPCHNSLLTCTTGTEIELSNLDLLWFMQSFRGPLLFSEHTALY